MTLSVTHTCLQQSVFGVWVCVECTLLYLRNSHLRALSTNYPILEQESNY